MVYAEEEFSCPNCDGEKENINLGDHEELNLIICQFSYITLHGSYNSIVWNTVKCM